MTERESTRRVLQSDDDGESAGNQGWNRLPTLHTGPNIRSSRQFCCRGCSSFLLSSLVPLPRRSSCCCSPTERPRQRIRGVAGEKGGGATGNFARVSDTSSHPLTTPTHHAFTGFWCCLDTSVDLKLGGDCALCRLCSSPRSMSTWLSWPNNPRLFQTIQKILVSLSQITKSLVLTQF